MLETMSNEVTKRGGLMHYTSLVLVSNIQTFIVLWFEARPLFLRQVMRSSGRSYMHPAMSVSGLKGLKSEEVVGYMKIASLSCLRRAG